MPKGILSKNSNDRFEILDDDTWGRIELTSGQTVELFNQVSEDWFFARIEFDGLRKCYYAVTDDGPIYNLEDQYARI